MDLVVRTLSYLLDKLIALRGHYAAKRQRLFVEVLMPLFRELETIHQDYLRMFEQALEATPFQWECGEPDFHPRLQAVAAQLRDVRLQFEPVREKLRSASEFLESGIEGEGRDFVTSVKRYFPDGNLRPTDRNEDAVIPTAATALIQEIYASLHLRSAEDIRWIIEETLRRQRQDWRQVCETFTKLQLAQIDRQ